MDVERIQELAAVAGYLCSASEGLVAAGYDGWGDELRALIEIISAEIGWLQTSQTNPVV